MLLFGFSSIVMSGTMQAGHWPWAFFSLGLSALAANLHLAFANSDGRSAGKSRAGLRLVIDDGRFERAPELARVLVRSALQAGPYMGALMLLTGLHDRAAGTTIVHAPRPQRIVSLDLSGAEAETGEGVPPAPAPAAGPPFASWKAAVAMAAHLAIATLYMFLAAV